MKIMKGKEVWRELEKREKRKNRENGEKERMIRMRGNEI